MYTDIKSMQIVIALLKKYNIRHLVLSAGNRHTPFARSVESDDFFTCYSIVDERSAGFFALGLIKQLKEPVVICCTSGTAVSNYVSSVSEAFFSKLPLVVITADRNPYYLYQQEEQMVPQVNLFKDICKKAVTLPFVNDKKDFWYCNRLVNEALLYIENEGKGPVHINVPVENNLFDFNTEKLPDVTKINTINLFETDKWVKKAEELKNVKKILITYGQAEPLLAEQEEIIESFAKKYGAVIMVDHLANLKCYGTVEAYTLSRTNYSKLITELVPDILIAMNGNAVEIRGWLVNVSGQYKFWNVLEGGEISDPFRSLTDIFKCSMMEFFERMLEFAPEDDSECEYLKLWESAVSKIKIPELEYSDVYVVKRFAEMLPENSNLNLGNSNSVRLIQHFPLKKSISVYCNRGVSGIDGSLSSFIGQACVNTELNFLLIGDLSFFYDMNGIWNRYIGNNVRILMNNNSCGEIFYTNAKQNKNTVGKHIAADHETDAKGWVESRGFLYLKAENMEEFEKNINKFFVEKYDKPIFFEVFTDKFKNLEQINNIIKINEQLSVKQVLKKTMKSIINK